MGCLVLLILAFVFRGAILGLLALLVGLLSLLLSLGIWGFIIIILLCAVVAALG